MSLEGRSQESLEPQGFEKKTHDELDDILDSALDELENDEDFASAGTQGRTKGTGDAYGVKAMEDEEGERAAKAFQSLLDDFSNPDIADSLEKAFQHLGQHAEGEQLLQDAARAVKQMGEEETSKAAAPGSTEGRDHGKSGEDRGREAGVSAAAAAGSGVESGGASERSDGRPAGSGEGEEGEFGFGDEADMERTIAKTLEMLAKSGAKLEGQEAANVEAAGEDVMRQMMGEFQQMGERKDYNQVMDNVMQQLLSKELMYDPIKQICEKYPEWLATHKESLSPADYERYGRQYQSFQRVLAVYETEPDNFSRLMELMQDMQEHGQVPAEIIKELAPGLEFSAEGMPVGPNMGEGMMPNLPGFPGFPGFPNGAAAGGDIENCCIC